MVSGLTEDRRINEIHLVINKQKCERKVQNKEVDKGLIIFNMLIICLSEKLNLEPKAKLPHGMKKVTKHLQMSSLVMGVV